MGELGISDPSIRGNKNFRCFNYLSIIKQFEIVQYGSVFVIMKSLGNLCQVAKSKYPTLVSLHSIQTIKKSNEDNFQVDGWDTTSTTLLIRTL